MRAGIADGRGHVVVEEIGAPAIRTPYDVLCENLYCATCVGTDLHIIDGCAHVPIAYPTILGHESVARVVEVGRSVRAFRRGDLVTRVGCPEAESLRANWGGFAEYGIARDHEAMRLDGVAPELWRAHRVNMRIPEGLIQPKLATMIVTWRETYSYTSRMGIGPGKSVLVSGSGANGLSIGYMARLLGAGEVVLVGSASRAKKALAMGFHSCVTYDDPSAMAEFLGARAGAFDYLVDCTGKLGATDSLMGCLRSGGTFGCYGRDDYARYGLNPFRAPGSFYVYGGGYDEYSAHWDVIEWIRRDRLDARLFLDATYSLNDIDKAYECTRARRVLKAVIAMKRGEDT